MHISQRCRRVAPSATLAIDARAKAMKAEGMDVISFGAGEPDFDTPEHIKQAAKDALDKGQTRYTPVAGILPLRQAICDKLKAQNNLEYKPGQIVVANGAKHALFNAILAVVDAGDEVILPTPCWVTYPEIVKLAEGVPVFIKTTRDQEYKPSIEQWKQAVTPRTRAIILNSPCNPCGCVYTEAELRELADFAVENDLVVISDEIYEHLIYDGCKHVSIASFGPEIYKRTIVVNGMSKSYAMTGWRIGYTAAPADVSEAITNFQSHSTSNINAMTQFAGIAALQGPQDDMEKMCAAFDERRKALVALIQAVPNLDCCVPKGAFYCMLDISGVLGKSYRGKKIGGSMDFADALLNGEKVAVVPGMAFEDDTICRLSYAISKENITRGLERIARFVAELTD